MKEKLIDDVLRTGGNLFNGKETLIVMYAYQDPEYPLHMKRYFGEHGFGIKTSDGLHTYEFTDMGIEEDSGNELYSWADLSQRVQQLIQNGMFASQDVLDRSISTFCKSTAHLMALMQRDCSIEYLEGYNFYHDAFVEQLSKTLEDHAIASDYRKKINDIQSEYQKDHSIFRFRPYSIDDILVRLSILSGTKRDIPSCKIDLKTPELFVPEFLLKKFLRLHPSRSSRLDTYQVCITDPSISQLAELLKNQYGTGGCGPAMHGMDHSWANYDSRGLSIKLADAEIKIPWKKAAEIIRKMILEGEFLQDGDLESIPEYERKYLAIRISNVIPSEKLSSAGITIHVYGFWDEIKEIQDHLLDATWTTTMIDIAKSLENEQSASLRNLLESYLQGTFSLFTPCKEWQAQVMAYNAKRQQEMSKPCNTVSLQDFDLVYLNDKKYEFLEIKNGYVIVRDASMPLFTEKFEEKEFLELYRNDKRNK